MYTSEMSEKFQSSVKKRGDRIISTFRTYSRNIVTSRMSREDHIRLHHIQNSLVNLSSLSRSYLCSHYLVPHTYMSYCVMCKRCKLVVSDISLGECHV